MQRVIEVMAGKGIEKVVFSLVMGLLQSTGERPRKTGTGGL